MFVTNVCPGPVRTGLAENALLPDGSTSNKKNDVIESGMTAQRFVFTCVHTVLYSCSRLVSAV